MTSFNIPWKCLALDPEPQSQAIETQTATIAPPKPQKTFAQALTNLCDIPLSQFQQPVVKGDRLAIEIPEAAYEAGLEACKHNLHGRILWPKGSTPLSVVALKEKLALIWKVLSKWGIISLGKGYFEFTFSSLEDVRRVRSIPSWNLNPGHLKFFAWSKDFNPKMQHNTSAQVWVKIFGLSQEYWHKNILFTIAGSIGTPICTDSVTAKPMHERTFGQFARVLIDIDLLQPLRYKLLVERKCFAFFVDLEYEHIPAFCTECKMIGHNFDNCKRWNMEEVRITMDNNTKQKAPEKRQIYVQTNDGRPQQVQSKSLINVEVINVEDNNSQPVLNNIDGNNNEKAPGSSNHEIGPSHVGPILSPVDPHEMLRLQDKHLEAELNVDSADSWSTDSQESFVDTTQLVVNDEQAAAVNDINDRNIVEEDHHQITTPLNPIDGGASKLDETQQLPERVARDMAFLKESWANMTETDDVIQQNVEDTSDTGFQLHLTKHQKKAQKKLKQSSRDSYATRSKVPPKPFR
jgi:hypothetical protein